MELRQRRKAGKDKRMNFASDNAAGVAPEILDAMARVNAGHALGYGNDDVTRRA